MTTPTKRLSLPDPVLTDRYLHVVGDGDEAAAIALVTGLLADGVPPARVIVDLIGAAQRRVGELWAANDWSIAREHAATAVSERALATVGALSPAQAYRGRITLACVDGEWHGLPARMFAELLRLDGWRVDFLGASVPGRHLITHLHQTGPDAVALSCMIPTRLPRAHTAITACRAAGIPVIAGGRGFGPDGRWAQLLGADAWAATGEEAVERLVTLTASSAADIPSFGDLNGFASPSDEEYTHLVRARPHLIATAMERLAATYPEAHQYTRDQADATAEDLGHIVDFLAAALYIGDPQIFTDFTSWTAEVLASRHVPPAALEAGLRLIQDQLIDFPTATTMLDAGLATLSR
ncbi:cobalamin-dependent protein [Actinoplanes sp. NBRC 101535]|uniref:cobalamin B12-binding domain-containing protein n=1 Tax=Actinoplanes sp. NBRC 101535 TaxID=3032196 RepID=UPI0024A5EFEA|nr:cobalamin-dependent protein [Actinoplanes sp. NBRC 101535]GLY00076.1 cobalamin-binding protein [Actinoplanes sp. NBRC 101535]